MSLSSHFLESSTNELKVSLLVSGYIREHESLQPKLIYIPPLVRHKCLEYYLINEYFDTANWFDICSGMSHDWFEISNDKMKVTNIGGNIEFNQHNIFCNHLIQSMSKCVVKWTFEVQKRNNDMQIIFGLNPYNNDRKYGPINDDNSPFGRSKEKPFYYISNKGVKYTDNHCEYDYDSYFSWENNDTIMFILDLIDLNGKFSMKINGEDEKIIFNHIQRGNNIKYRMAVHIEGNHDFVVLRNFEQS